ncbi:WG repeat-containing protein [Clostridium sp.]|uniref:WG repeat-containing protein n=1 Tax=Clostridium sp. TaxID=1506 RepID=UPI003D6D2C21
MAYPLEFITWLEDHDDLCNELFHSSAITEYLKGHIEWYPVISFHMGCEDYNGDFDTEFNRRVNLLYEMFISGEIKHRLVPNKKTLYGYIDKTGAFTIEPKFDNALDFYNGRAWVSTNNKYGVINKKGQYLIEPLYDAVGSSTENATWVKLNGVWGLLDNNSKFIMEPRYDFDSMESYNEDLMSVTIYEKVGFIDTKGNMVIRPCFNGGGLKFSEGLAPVSLGIDDPWWGFTDKCGVIVFEGFEDAGNFSNGLAAVLRSGTWNYINKNGQTVIETEFEEAYDFEEGLACIKINGMYGFINDSGNYVIEPKYVRSTSFRNGFSNVTISGKEGFINKSGEIVVEPKFDLVFPFEEGLAVVYLNGKCGCINSKGNFIIEQRFDSAFSFSDGLMCVGMQQ